MEPQIRMYRTTDPEILARHLRNSETKETYWRLYKRDPKDGKFATVKILKESEVRRCELCRTLILDKPNARFCSEGCGQRHFDMAQVDAEENSFWSNDY